MVGRGLEGNSLTAEEDSKARETAETSSVSGNSGDAVARMDPNYEGPGTWYNVMPRFRDRWQQRYGSTGTDRWDDFEPGYRYGWEMRNQPRYRGRTWSEVEPEFREDWNTRNSDRPWDRFSESVREAWEDNEEEPRQNTDFDRSGSEYDSTTNTYQIVGGEGYPPHEHRFTGDRCEVCGATRRYGRAA